METGKNKANMNIMYGTIQNIRSGEQKHFHNKDEFDQIIESFYLKDEDSRVDIDPKNVVLN